MHPDAEQKDKKEISHPGEMDERKKRFSEENVYTTSAFMQTEREAAAGVAAITPN